MRRGLPVLSVVLVLTWLGLGALLGPYAGKLSQVQNNDNKAFLPASSPSTQVLDALPRFAHHQTVPTTVVYERRTGLTGADLTAIRQDARALAHVRDVPSRGGVRGPVRSADGQAAQLVVQVAASSGARIQADVKAITAAVTPAPDGLVVEVGGQGGILGDFVAAFGAIDGILLVVTLVVVLGILLVVYRSPVLPIVVLLGAGLALGVASAVVYALVKGGVIGLNGQSQGILFILAIGAATDYSLLLVSRYREELRENHSQWEALRTAYRASVEPILASGLTVILSLLCLLLSDLKSLAGLGPVGALGIAGAMLTSLTLLPAVLGLLGRAAFWPFRPAYGSSHPHERGLWHRVSSLVGRRPRRVWVGCALVLTAAACFVPTLNEKPTAQTDVFLTDVASVKAQRILDAHFTQDAASPLQILVPAADVAPVAETLLANDGIAQRTSGGVPPVYFLPSGGNPRKPKVVRGEALVFATLAEASDSAQAESTVQGLRVSLAQISPRIRVGGQAAVNYDVRATVARDRRVVIPAILLVIFVVLALLLRSLVAPVLLLVANVLSFGATLGISAVLFDHVFHFPGSDLSTPLIGFVFLVALGIDYSIFLMTRVREESARDGTRPGILKGLAVTGGVITSAGVVLASTFAALGVIPILFLAQIAFIVAFGVLLDTIVVRSLFVPALGHDLGGRIWWPSRLRAS